jgi:hypothetical protein
MHELRIHFLLIVALCVAATAIALAASSRVFELPDYGALTLTVPDGWTDKMNHPANRLPPTILLRPAAAGSGEVLLTAVWPIPPATRIRTRPRFGRRLRRQQRRLHPNPWKAHCRFRS